MQDLRSAFVRGEAERATLCVCKGGGGRGLYAFTGICFGCAEPYAWHRTRSYGLIAHVKMRNVSATDTRPLLARASAMMMDGKIMEARTHKTQHKIQTPRANASLCCAMCAFAGAVRAAFCGVYAVFVRRY